MSWLINWYKNQCDGDWEHCYGVRISSLDNPGWRLSVSLGETGLESKKFIDIEIERTESDWVHCFIKNRSFEAACGVSNLMEAIEIFRKWVEN
ncbi:putative uncharacterized protein [Waddlia chondrophila 2032/99]|uniref:Rhodanese-related sulfurtransferase n=1 Tax=Waddlia chondrophila 2032/99 TaxID=765953 RepID=F8LER6_9BACT|nr:putative uncharacterized protein [Waddlia chondrophila 2032/99]